MAAIREKLNYANLPKGLEGLGITMITTGLMAMGFMCFAGIDLKPKEKPEASPMAAPVQNKGQKGSIEGGDSDASEPTKQGDLEGGDSDASQPTRHGALNPSAEGDSDASEPT